MTTYTRKRLFYPSEEKYFPSQILFIRHHIIQTQAPLLFQANIFFRIMFKNKTKKTCSSRKQTHCGCVLLCLIFSIMKSRLWKGILCRYFYLYHSIITFFAVSHLLLVSGHKWIKRLSSKHNVQTNNHRWVKTQSSCHKCHSHLTTCTLRPPALTSSQESQPSKLQHPFTRLQSASSINQSSKTWN